MKLDIKNGRFVNASNIGTLYLGKNGFYFLVQIMSIIVTSNGLYSREWEHARNH